MQGKIRRLRGKERERVMKKREKYLYDKIMFGKKRNVREVSLRRNSCRVPFYNWICSLLGII